jgi:hypothetical protein
VRVAVWLLLLPISQHTMARKRKSLTPWKIAKPLLQKDILAGRIPRNMPPREVIILRPKYGRVDYKNCVTILGNLQNGLKASGNTANVNKLALAHNRRLHPIKMEDPTCSILVGTVPRRISH